MRLVWTVLFVSLLSSVYCVTPTPRPADGCSSMSVRLRAFRLMAACNFTTLKEKQLKEIQAPTTNLYLPMMYLLAFCVGLPSNLLALWVLVVRTKRLPSTTLLINLSVADCLLLLMLPFRISYHFRGNHWELGEPFCRVVMAMFYGNMYGSMWCLALVAFDRYIALVHPFRARTLRTRRVSLYMTATVWLVVLAAMLPLLVSRQTYRLDDPQITTCHDALPEEEQQNFFLPYFASLFGFCFVLPFVTVVYCHCAVLHTLLAEGKRYGRAIRVTVLVLLVFIVCLLPSNILLLLTYTDSDMDGDGEDLYVPYMVSLAVSTFNSCIDPFIFYYVSEEFRQKANNVLCCRDDPEGKSSSTGQNVSSSSSQRSKSTLLSMSSHRRTPEKANTST
ncbi:proteinase-activated receptor 4 [Salarias fasciatus]|uniref:G-protein coupled receptors family 1 profile domain-containing protein n=1 Tax=Salarias fasciatus TaxID=181472 RepID=A0A672H0H6_SALFA|nr:proteinase-activated receptor 4 [Salarias fasciatus]